MSETLSSDDLKWRARDDAYTLARAEEVKADESRLELAKKEAANLLKEKEADVAGLKKITGKQSNTLKTKHTQPQKNTNGYKQVSSNVGIVWQK